MPSKRCLKPECELRLQRINSSSAGCTAQKWAVIICIEMFCLLFLGGVVRADSSSGAPGGVLASQVITDSGKSAEEVEYQVKAAFIYNFMKFTEWPPEKMENGEHLEGDSSPGPMQIGIVGENPFGKAFEPLMGKKIKERSLKLVFIPSMAVYVKKNSDKNAAAEQYWQEQGKLLRSCHVVFYCNSEKSWLTEHLREAQKHPLLTVGEMEGFLSSKGIIGFVKEDNKIRFEIHLTQAEKQGLKISSQLLKLARRVIQEKETNGKGSANQS